MDNFDAIKRMDKTQLETFLDQVYLTGVNSGMYAATLPNDEYILDALATAVLRSVGISVSEEEE